MSATNFSNDGVEFLIGWEGMRLNAYKDQAEELTIGVGHLLTFAELKSGVIVIDGINHAWRNGITRETALALKRQDLLRFVRIVNAIIKKELRQHELDALVCLAYNIGESAFSCSTVVDKINSAAPRNDIIERWIVWNKVTVNGIKKISVGLTKRRKAEIAVYFEADYSGRP
jgi:lysozyme